MTYEEARRRLEATTRFDLRDGYVWLREVRWLRAAEESGCERGVAEPLPSRCVAPPPGVRAIAL